MATIHERIEIDADPDAVWAAVRDVGAVHTRLARGFVTDTVLTNGTRIVTFANGWSVKERIVSLDEANRRLAYSADGGLATHHHASFQVLPGADGRTQLVWITDVLPDEARGPLAEMVRRGTQAIVKTLAETGRSGGMGPADS